MSSPDGSVVLEWGDGEYCFQLLGKQIEHIELVTKLPIGQVAARLFSRMPAYRDVRETIHQGLIGGGMDPVTATQKMKAFFDGQPLDRKGDKSSPLNTAIAIMGAAWFGLDELPSGNVVAGENPAPSTSPVTEQPSQTSE